MLKAIRFFREAKQKEDQGIKAFWPKFMLSAMEAYTAQRSIPEQPDKPTLPGDPATDPEQVVRDLVISNPEMNAAGLVKAMKDKNLTVVDKDQSLDVEVDDEEECGKEADGASGNAPVLRANPKMKKKESSAISIAVKMREGISKDNPMHPVSYKVILIQEGLGNLKDCYYYTKKALESGVTLFEGKKIYADHPDAVQEQIRPERSVRDIIGHYENCRLEEDNGCAQLVADLQTVQDASYQWARSLINHSIEYTKKYPTSDFVGLSINASGDAEPMDMAEFLKSSDIPKSAVQKLQQAMSEGINQVKVVNALTSAVSCDLVTEAGAKGKILQMLEKEKQMADEKKKEKMKQAEDEAKQKKAEADEKKEDESEKKEGDDEDAGHDDAAQDKDLIAKMLKKHLGDTAEDQEVMKHAHEAYEAYKEMGYDENEAAKCAGHAIKLAKHMASKSVPEEKPPGSGDAKPGMESEKHEDEADEKKESKEDESEKKESSVVIKLQGENARLKESLKKYELNEILDKKLAALKESRQVTDLIRKSVKVLKSESQIDDAIKLFMEGYRAKVEPTSFGEPLTLEKTVQAPGEKVTSFGDCK